MLLKVKKTNQWFAKDTNSRINMRLANWFDKMIYWMVSQEDSNSG